MSDSLDSALGKLTARRLDDVLDEMGDLAARHRAGEPVRVPLVTLYVDSGAVFIGYILGIEPEPRGGKWLLVHLPGEGSRQPAPDIVYLHGDHLVALVIHDATEMGKPPVDSPALTRLELRRAVEKAQGELVGLLDTDVKLEVDWDKLPDSGDELWALDYLLRTTSTVLKEIAAEGMGRQALAGKLRTVQLGVGEKADALFKDGTLRLTSGMAPAARLSAGELKKVLEAGL